MYDAIRSDLEKTEYELSMYRARFDYEAATMTERLNYKSDIRFYQGYITALRYALQKLKEAGYDKKKA